MNIKTLLSSNRPKNWRQEYLRILDSPTLNKEDYGFARELVDGGYARGQYLKSSRGYDEIASFVWLGASTSGRTFGCQLREQLRQETFWFRIKQSGVWLSGVATGALLNAYAPVLVASVGG